MPAGRPSEYKEEYAQKVDEYLALNIDEEYDWVKTTGEKSTTVEHRIKVKLPTIEGFALFIGVPRRTVFDWKEEKEDFSHSLDKILAEQQRRLLNSGLSGDYNSTIAKLILSSNHGMSERNDLTSCGKPISILNALLSDNSDKKDSQDVKADSGDTGRNIGKQDSIDSLIGD